jgi:predicted amidohydrolase YtcJ
MNQAMLDRAKTDGVILVFHSYMWEYGEILSSYGPERLAMMHAYHTAIAMGIPVAGHSHSPVSAAYPLRRIQDMVTRKDSSDVLRGENQRVSVDEAIKIWTLDGAYATFEENIKGSITPGKLADFVVLENDPRKALPLNSLKMQTLLLSTMVTAITSTGMKEVIQGVAIRNKTCECTSTRNVLVPLNSTKQFGQRSRIAR